MTLRFTYYEFLTEEEREYGRKSVNATKESIKRDVQHLIEWFEQQPHLPNYKDEDVLEGVLLMCKCSLEKCKRRLETFFNAKATFPEIFRDLNPYTKDIEDVKNLGLYVPLPKLTPDGYRVLILHLSDDFKTRTDFPSMDKFFKLNEMSIELMMKLGYCRGAVLIHNSPNFLRSFFIKCALELRKMDFLQHNVGVLSYPKVYICNMNPAAEIVFSAIKSFLKPSFLKRIEILAKPTDVSNVLPKEILPEEYGGDEISLNQLKDIWFENLKNNYDYLQSVQELASDLSKAPQKSNTSEFSGVEGSFRQISFD